VKVRGPWTFSWKTASLCGTAVSPVVPTSMVEIFAVEFWPQFNGAAPAVRRKRGGIPASLRC